MLHDVYYVLFISKSQDEDSQMMTEVDLFISTKAVKVLNADTQVSPPPCCSRVHSVSCLLHHHCESMTISLLSGNDWRRLCSTQETMMDSALRTISYIADIGSIVVLMARRRMSQASSDDFPESPDSASEDKSQYRMICYVFESEDVSVHRL